MVALSCAGHLRSAGPRWSNRRSRGRSARLGVRGAVAPVGVAGQGQQTGRSASGARRRRAPRSARSSGNRRARHLTREHVCQRYVLAGQVAISRVKRRARGLSDDLANRARHDMRDTVPPCEMRIEAKRGRGAGTAPDAARAAPDDHPGRSRRARLLRRARRRPEQTATTTFTLHAFKTTPEQHSRCVVLPDAAVVTMGAAGFMSQCTYRCVVLPDED